MKKKSKYGFNTGNSLLQVYSARFCRYAVDQMSVVKRIESPDSCSDKVLRILNQNERMIPDGGINGNIFQDLTLDDNRMFYPLCGPQELTYSLNKQHRWLLPELLKDYINRVRYYALAEASEKQLETCCWHVSLLERQIQFNYGRVKFFGGTHPSVNLRKGDAVSYSTSYGPSDIVTHKKGLSTQTDLRGTALHMKYQNKKVGLKKQRRIGHNQHFRDLQRKGRMVTEKETVKSVAPAISEVYYEICSPQRLCKISFYKDYFFGPKLKAKKKRKGCKNKERRDDNMRTKDLQKLAEHCMEWDEPYSSD